MDTVYAVYTLASESALRPRDGPCTHQLDVPAFLSRVSLYYSSISIVLQSTLTPLSFPFSAAGRDPFLRREQARRGSRRTQRRPRGRLDPLRHALPKMQAEIRPGIVTKDSSGCNRCQTIYSRIVSLHPKSNQLQFAACQAVSSVSGRRLTRPSVAWIASSVRSSGPSANCPKSSPVTPPITFPTHHCMYLCTTTFLFR